MFSKISTNFRRNGTAVQSIFGGESGVEEGVVLQTAVTIRELNDQPQRVWHDSDALFRTPRVGLLPFRFCSSWAIPILKGSDNEVWKRCWCVPLNTNGVQCLLRMSVRLGIYLCVELVADTPSESSLGRVCDDLDIPTVDNQEETRHTCRTDNLVGTLSPSLSRR